MLLGFTRHEVPEPHLFETSEPSDRNLVERKRVKIVPPFPPVPPRNDQPCTFQNLKVFVCRLSRYAHICRKLTDRSASVFQQGIEHIAAVRIGQSLKNGITVHARLCNQMAAQKSDLCQS